MFLNLLREHFVNFNSCVLFFRDGLDAFVDMTFRMDIPFLIFSAGIGDVIDACLVQHGLKKTNVHTISNFATFAPDGKFIGEYM